MTKTSSNIAQAAQSAASPSDPYQREQQIFPKLDDEQIDRLISYGNVEDLPAGTILFQRGDQQGIPAHPAVPDPQRLSLRGKTNQRTRHHRLREAA